MLPRGLPSNQSKCAFFTTHKSSNKQALHPKPTNKHKPYPIPYHAPWTLDHRCLPLRYWYARTSDWRPQSPTPRLANVPCSWSYNADEKNQFKSRASLFPNKLTLKMAILGQWPKHLTFAWLNHLTREDQKTACSPPTMHATKPLLSPHYATSRTINDR